MSEHFIKNIEIKNFKCFEDFKAEGFGRVNLIGGKNNVGKTAFMEACFFASSKDIDEIKNRYMIIKFNRNPIKFITNKYNIQNNFQVSKFTINGMDTITSKPFTILVNDEKKSIAENINFVTLATNFNEELLVNIIGELKLNNQYSKINDELKNIFDIENIDTIKNEIMLKKDGNYQKMSSYGDGLKHYIAILSSLLVSKNKIIYIDEIENGIHYTNLDKLWEIILTISKEKNVQVFATTHSKECIESYARVAKKLADEEITFLSLYKNREDELKSITLDYQTIQDRIELGLDNR